MKSHSNRLHVDSSSPNHNLGADGVEKGRVVEGTYNNVWI